MDKLNFKDFGLGDNILKSIKRLNYKTPSEVQSKVIPLILKNKDIIVKSQTGSGKTAAYAIPICEKIELEENSVQVLVLVPTRELSIQVKDDFSNIGRFKRLRCVSIFGKEPVNIQKNKLKQRVHIVAGTPGRTLDHIKRGTLNLNNIMYLIIDEADEMLNMGFIDQVKSILNKLPKNKITLLFSATMPDEILGLCNEYMLNPINIEIESKNPTLERIKQIYYEVENDKKFNLLKKLIYTQRPISSMIFCSTKKNVDDLLLKMKDSGFLCASFHGGMLQPERIDILNRFKRGEFTFLICTDIAARGIDIENITHVINYDIPMEKENYIHRIGRTARIGKSGIAITFVTHNQYRFLDEIVENFNLNIQKSEIPSNDEVQNGKQIFDNELENPIKLKTSKSKKVDKDITKIYISAGKKKKIRPGDIAGTISSIDGVDPDDIGIIDIKDNFSYVDILSNKGNLVIEKLKLKTIKGKKIRAEIAQK
ncbi:DEAD/DEAH box helicase [Clostridium fermenticellae]|uniref:ATP-dependent RNA helicase DbpA n=1 Tax=Clostridium fermenticellae TaxID=2068654 RepID=A0A386H3L7_9CLOT|nr:DEAD/DEAH box helicase [Clostridium fermenticellae]AYD40256.1 DEAD/DEAH box helicase [Clostridium fermenticellae]